MKKLKVKIKLDRFKIYDIIQLKSFNFNCI